MASALSETFAKALDALAAGQDQSMVGIAYLQGGHEIHFSAGTMGETGDIATVTRPGGGEVAILIAALVAVGLPLPVAKSAAGFTHSYAEKGSERSRS